MTQAQNASSSDNWPSKRWTDRLKYLVLGIPPEPPEALSTFISDIALVEREVAKLGPDNLNFEESWLFEPMGQWAHTPLWFYVYQVQAIRQSPERCRQVLNILWQQGANLLRDVRKPALLGTRHEPHPDDAAFIELRRVGDKIINQRREERYAPVLDAIRTGGGRIYPLHADVERLSARWSSTPGGPPLDLRTGEQATSADD